MMKTKISAIMLLLGIILCGCGANDGYANSIRNAETIVEDNTVISIEDKENELPIIDYVDVIKESEKYSGKTIAVAGRISEFSSGYEFEFRDRTGFEGAGLGFCVNLEKAQFPKGTSAEDMYAVGDCVIVKGIWQDGYSPDLIEAEIISTGKEAQEYVETFMAEWTQKGEHYAETLPITDYMDIAASPELFEGKRVRTVGKIQAVGQNVATWHKYFSFRDRQTNVACISFSLKGCPDEMQDICIEDEFVVLSGVIHTTFSKPSLSECYVECVGDKAQSMAEQSESTWKQNWISQREEYIQDCATYEYDSLARYPDQYEKKHIAVSGSVIQCDTIWGENVVLLDVGQSNVIYVSYVGKQHSDPEILVGDKLTFYGECAKTKTYTTVLGNNNTVPYLMALYSSANQLQQKNPT